MANKDVLYIHGFASSGQSGTVSSLRALLPDARVTAPDLPVHPAEAMALLRDTCATMRPALIIGTSMGGMYAEMLYGYDRIVVNPAFGIAKDLRQRGLGRVDFQSPRDDGMQSFLLTKRLLEEFAEVSSGCLGERSVGDQEHVWGLFGTDDPIVHTHDLFAGSYRNAVWFHGEHRLNDHTLLHAVLPIIRWIDDNQEHRQRPIVYVAYERGMDMNGASRACSILADSYEVLFVAQAPTDIPDYEARVKASLFDSVGVLAWGHTIFTNRKDLLYGDYLIDPLTEGRSADFLGTRIALGSDSYKTWDDILTFFSRLGGQ